MNILKKQNIFGIHINTLNYDNVLKFCLKNRDNKGKAKVIFFLNAHCYNTAQTNKEYLNAVNNADLLLNDGIGITIASKLAGVKLSQNMNGTDLIPYLLKETAEYSFTVYMLGAREGCAASAGDHLQRMYPHVQIAGYHSGYFTDEADEQKVISDINKSKADILVVGMGVPTQELWITKHSGELKGIKQAIAGGAVIDFLAGRVKRAPNWMRILCLEWLYRLLQEPKRLSKRYLNGNLIFLYTILYKFAQKTMKKNILRIKSHTNS